MYAQEDSRLLFLKGSKSALKATAEFKQAGKLSN